MVEEYSISGIDSFIFGVFGHLEVPRRRGARRVRGRFCCVGMAREPSPVGDIFGSAWHNLVHIGLFRGTLFNVRLPSVQADK